MIKTMRKFKNIKCHKNNDKISDENDENDDSIMMKIVNIMGRVMKNKETCCTDKQFIENSIEPYRVKDPANLC